MTRPDSREILLRWLDSQGDAWVEVTCPQHGMVAGLNLAAVKPNIAYHRYEESRRALLHLAFRLAGRVEGTTCAAWGFPGPSLRLTTTAWSLVPEIKTYPTSFGRGGR